MSKEIIALYEIKRQSYLLGFIQNPDKLDSALAYAYDRRIVPYFHHNLELEIYGDDPFEDVYSIKHDFFNEVLTFLDDNWSAKNLEEVRFYRLEDRFGRVNRVNLIKILTYCRIQGLFDGDFWKSIASASPAEANNIRDKFEPNDVSI